MLDMVMGACRDLDVTVLYYTSLAPFDADTLKKEYNGGKIVVCEPHYSGTLDYDIIDALAGRSVQIEHIGFPREIFRNYGTYEDKMEYYGLNAEHIRNALVT